MHYIPCCRYQVIQIGQEYSILTNLSLPIRGWFLPLNYNSETARLHNLNCSKGRKMFVARRSQREPFWPIASSRSWLHWRHEAACRVSVFSLVPCVFPSRLHVCLCPYPLAAVLALAQAQISCPSSLWGTIPVVGPGTTIGCNGVGGSGLTVGANTTIGDYFVIGMCIQVAT